MATEVTPGGLREQAALARKERARGPATGPFTISVHLPTFVWDGPGAWELIRDHHRYVAWKYDDMDAARGRAGAPPAPPPPLTPGEEEQLRSSIVMGTPDEVAGQIDEYRRAPAATCTTSPGCTSPGCRGRCSSGRCGCSRSRSSRGHARWPRGAPRDRPRPAAGPRPLGRRG